ncbi:unannotated protein [freshwater metagenome]|uniref:Unannotated protein n=1 Tax=freshwater metagenome TaxID=449393 RepID=A0A6J6URB5_9ZZZZ
MPCGIDEIVDSNADTSRLIILPLGSFLFAISMSSPSNAELRRFPILPPPGVIAIASETALSKTGSEEINHATSARVFERAQALTLNAISNT